MFLNLMEDSKRLEDQNGYIFLSNIYKIFDAIAEEIIETKNKIIYKNKILNDIISYIDNNFGNKITTKTIAEEFYISPQYLARIFKKEVEMTPSEYLTSVRLSKAANMLTNTNFSITTISELVGFSNPFYFTNSFRAKYLIPPRHYRDLQILQKKKELN